MKFTVLVLVFVFGVNCKLIRKSIDPCYVPNSQECKDLHEKVEKDNNEFLDSFTKEGKKITEEFLKSQPDPKKGFELVIKQLAQNDSPLKRKLVEATKKKGMADVSRGLALSSKVVVSSVGPFGIATVANWGLLFVDVYVTSLEELSNGGVDQLAKDKLSSVLTNLSAAEGQIGLVIGKVEKGEAKTRAEGLLKRIKSVNKKVDIAYEKRPKN